MKSLSHLTLLVLAIMLSISIASTGQAQQKEQIEYSFMTLKEYLKAPEAVQVIDVRSEQSRERSKKEVPGEIWINPYKKKPLDDFIAQQDKSKAYMIYCSCPDDGYSIRAAQILFQNGFTNVKVLKDAAKHIEKGRLPMVDMKGEKE
jgi:rhodanese-related sulfurtransferase